MNDIGITHLSRETAEIREAHWQGRILWLAPGKLGAFMMSVIAHQIGDPIAVKTLLEVTFPGYAGIALPFYSSCGRITATGRIIAEMVDRQHRKQWTVVFANEASMEAELRWLADIARLSDDDRVAMFDAVKKWITCDYRLDPNTGERETERDMKRKYRKVS